MSSAQNLVAGRLSRNLPQSLSGQTQPLLTVTGYGVSRLGLVRPEAAQAEQPRQPAATRPRLRDGVPLKKVTTILALPLANRLKAYCGAAGRFQYAVIAPAIDRYLLEVVGQLNGAQKDKMAEIAAGLCDEAAPAEAGADAAALPRPVNTACAGMTRVAPPAGAAPVAPSGDGAAAAQNDAPAEAARPGHDRLACILSHLLPRCWRS
jgi:hypothetical protein